MNILVCCEKLSDVALWYQGFLAEENLDSFHVDCYQSVVEVKKVMFQKKYDVVIMEWEVNGRKTKSLLKVFKLINKNCFITLISDYNHLGLALKNQINQFIYQEELTKNHIEKYIKMIVKAYKKHMAKCVFYSLEGKIMFDPGEILYIETMGRYLKLVTYKGSYMGRFRHYKELKQKLLDYQFIQIHQSFFVNMNAISCLRKGEATLNNNETIPTSIHKRHIIQKKLAIFLKTPS